MGCSVFFCRNVLFEDLFPSRQMIHMNANPIMRFISGTLCLLFIVTIGPGRLAAEDASEEDTKTRRYINFDPAQSSRYLFLPVTMYINIAFDSAQVPAAFPQNDYFINHRRLFDKISNPIRAINKDGGWAKFFSDEMLSERVLPNITLHLMGGGYEFRTLAEWYEYHGFPVPYLLSFITFYAAEYGNEAIEYNNKVLTSHDFIADLLIFDLLGPLLFLDDDIAAFFHDTLQMRNWSSQPIFSLSQLKFINVGTSFVLRPYAFGETVRPFIYIGMNYLLGASFRISDTDCLSYGVGISVTKPFDPARDTQRDYLRKIRTAGGIFWDRKDAPLVTLLVNATEQYQYRLNVYPELFDFEHLNVGFFLAIDDTRHFVWGIALYKVIPIGMTM